MVLNLVTNKNFLSISEALTKIKELVVPVLQTEPIYLDSGVGRVLSDDVFSPIPLPPFKSSAMDGFALRLSDWGNSEDKTFNIAGVSLAGHPNSGRIKHGECVRVFTGAKVPDECDQIILQEEVEFADESIVRFQDHQPSETYVRPVGHDIDRNQQIAMKGQELNPISLSRMSASGVSKVNVFRKPKIGVLSSGDELVSAKIPYRELKDGQIFESNKTFLLRSLEKLNVEIVDHGSIGDSREETEQALNTAAKSCDLLITTGGVSVGDADHITKTIQALGSLDFWRLNLKPGKPLAFGSIGDCKILGLPGNPVSTIVTTLLLAYPLIEHLKGTKPKDPLKVKARTKTNILHSAGRTEYQRGLFTSEPDGTIVVEQLGDQSSNRLSSFNNCNCLIEIPSTRGNLALNDEVTILPMVNFGIF